MSERAEHVLVTGGAGFIGSHLVDALLDRPAARVTVLDALTYAGSRANLSAHEGDERFVFAEGDVADTGVADRLVAGVDRVLHAAAESHVDRSITGPAAFVRTNVTGTQVLLDACRAHGRPLLMVSTDEVYGANADDDSLFAEDAPLRPRSPYAASKAAADLLCAAYHVTYGTPVTVVRGTNAFGPRQNPEKAIPTYVTAALDGRPLPVYDRGRQRREWLFVTDWAAGCLAAMDRGEPGAVYNIGAGHELSNLDLARAVCARTGADPASIGFVDDRPGHDFRYGVRSDLLRALGWSPRVAFDEGLARTVEWYREHRSWADEMRAAATR
ncbi:MAG: dTDP-glucose 4,6-dehydratase [Actinomycetota bacterium]